MPHRVRPRAVVEEVYGFPFPDDLYAFHDFAHANPASLETLELELDGPFALIEGRTKGITKSWDPGGNSPRFLNDPPEFFTVAVGDHDGLHWGYWFDDPATLPPVVTSYLHSGDFDLGNAFDSIFDAIRAHLEDLHAEAELHLIDDAEFAADHRATLEALASTRTALSKFAHGDRPETGHTYRERYATTTKPRTSRKPTAMTGNKLGIVVPKKAYRPLSDTDMFQGVDHKPTAKEVEALVKSAEVAMDEGFAGSALKLGHDLWPYAAFQAESYELLDSAYGALGRKVLRDYLKRAIAFRKRCAAK